MAETNDRGENLDALLPPQMALRAESVGQAKAKLDSAPMFALAVLAGAFIAWGAVFATTVTTSGGDTALPFGVTKLIGGLSFSLGLILVIVGGAELFTGNNLIVMAWASRRITTQQVLRNWLIVYLGNFVGAFGVAILVSLAGHSDNEAVRENILKIATAKCSLDWTRAIAAGIACNVLVCLAVWLCMSARTVTDKVVAIIFPIAAFVATGMEHCVANMYFIPAGMLARFRANIPADDYAEITMTNFLWNNLLPVTIGNVIGGTVLVGLVYWFVYLRGRDK
ncbi:MAG: formate transporter [Pirellulaceae bacterium]|jgi:formate transporter